MAATLLSKIILAATAIAFILYVVGFSSPYWIQKDFVLKSPFQINTTVISIDIKVSSNMGLLRSCDETTYVIPNNEKTKRDCGTDGAKDWQKIAGGLGIAALVLSFLSLSLCAGAVFVSKLHGCKKLRTSVVVINFISVGLMLASLILYVVNKKIKVNEQLPDIIDYDIYWAFYITVVSAAMFALLLLVNVFDIVWNSSKSSIDFTKEPSVAFANK